MMVPDWRYVPSSTNGSGAKECSIESKGVGRFSVASVPACGLVARFCRASVLSRGAAVANHQLEPTHANESASGNERSPARFAIHPHQVAAGQIANPELAPIVGHHLGVLGLQAGALELHLTFLTRPDDEPNARKNANLRPPTSITHDEFELTHARWQMIALGRIALNSELHPEQHAARRGASGPGDGPDVSLGLGLVGEPVKAEIIVGLEFDHRPASLVGKRQIDDAFGHLPI